VDHGRHGADAPLALRRAGEDGFFDSFGFVCLDECHHATAETYNKILNRFSARYRVGVSATPDKTGDFELARMVLGPIIHTTHPHEVTNLIKPRVVKIPTKFGFGFRGHRSRRSARTTRR
jgi:superfamily II DNA or RNA helicase